VKFPARTFVFHFSRSRTPLGGGAGAWPSARSKAHTYSNNTTAPEANAPWGMGIQARMLMSHCLVPILGLVLLETLFRLAGSQFGQILRLISQRRPGKLPQSGRVRGHGLQGTTRGSARATGSPNWGQTGGQSAAL